MKSLSDLTQNFKPAVYQKPDDIVIDDFAKNIIDKVFDQLAIIFPAWKHNWKSDDPSMPDKILQAAKMEWTKAFNENDIKTIEQIKCGFAKARKADTDFLPSCGKFISWCKPSAEDLGYPSEQQAMRECIKYRNNQKMFTPLPLYTRPMIIELCKRVDWFMINSAVNDQARKRAEKHFNDEYMALVTSGYQEPEVTEFERLETSSVVIERMSDEQKQDAKKRGLDVLSEVKRKLKHKGDKQWKT